MKMIAPDDDDPCAVFALLSFVSFPKYARQLCPSFPTVQDPRRADDIYTLLQASHPLPRANYHILINDEIQTTSPTSKLIRGSQANLVPALGILSL